MSYIVNTLEGIVQGQYGQTIPISVLDVDGDVNVSSGSVYRINGEPISDGDGWIPVSETWTRTGNHTFTVSGDLTAKYRKGTKIRYRDGGSDEYGVIGSSSHSGGTTTVTLITNSDYAMAAATITNTYLSYIENPAGFPHWFTYSPTWAASGSMTYTSVTVLYARWMVVGRMIKVIGKGNGTTGGTASNTLTATLPVNAVHASSNPPGYSYVFDGGTFSVAGFTFISSGNLASGRKPDSSNFALGADKQFAFDVSYEF